MSERLLEIIPITDLKKLVKSHLWFKNCRKKSHGIEVMAMSNILGNSQGDLYFRIKKMTVENNSLLIQFEDDRGYVLIEEPKAYSIYVVDETYPVDWCLSFYDIKRAFIKTIHCDGWSHETTESPFKIVGSFDDYYGTGKTAEMVFEEYCEANPSPLLGQTDELRDYDDDDDAS